MHASSSVRSSHLCRSSSSLPRSTRGIRRKSRFHPFPECPTGSWILWTLLQEFSCPQWPRGAVMRRRFMQYRQALLGRLCLRPASDRPTWSNASLPRWFHPVYMVLKTVMLLTLSALRNSSKLTVPFLSLSKWSKSCWASSLVRLKP